MINMSGSFLPSLGRHTTRVYSGRGSQHCYEIKWNRAKSRCPVMTYQALTDPRPLQSPKVASHDGIPANHQETEYLSITQSHVPSFWRRATSEVTVPLRLRVEVRARSPQMSAGRCSPNSNFLFSGPNPVIWSLVKNS